MPQLITRDQIDNADLTWIETIWQQPIQRVFWIYNVPLNSARGGHRHQSCRMILQCVVGSVGVYVQTQNEEYRFTLNSATNYLLLEARDWRLMHQFSANAVLVVYAEKPFETTEYLNHPYHPVNPNLKGEDVFVSRETSVLLPY